MWWRSIQLFSLRGQRRNLEDALTDAKAKGDTKEVGDILLMITQMDLRIANHEARRRKS